MKICFSECNILTLTVAIQKLTDLTGGTDGNL